MGLYQAVRRGYFREAGIDVDIRPVNEEMRMGAAVLAVDQPVFGVAEGSVLFQECAFVNVEETIDLLIAEYNPEIDRVYQIESLKPIGEPERPGGSPALPPIRAERMEISQERFLQFGLLERPVEVEGLLRQSPLSGRISEVRHVESRASEKGRLVCHDAHGRIPCRFPGIDCWLTLV